MWITNATYPKVYVKPERHFQRRFGLPSLGPTTHKCYIDGNWKADGDWT